MNSENDALPNNKEILLAVNNLQLTNNNLQIEMDNGFEEVNRRFEQIVSRFEQIDESQEVMRLQMLSFDVRIDRIKALTNEVLTVADHARADVKILREEVNGSAKDVRD